MLMFSTRLPLKADICQQDCLRVFFDWILSSPHYTIESMTYDINSYKDFDYTQGSLAIALRHYDDAALRISAYRFVNEEPNFQWTTDCIYMQEGEDKSLLIQLFGVPKKFNMRIPRAHRPHLVKKYVEAGFCADDNGIPVCAIPLIVEKENNYETCVDIMLGKKAYSMPVVYISCGYWGDLDVNTQYLSRALSGIAHVFVQTEHDTALKLREDTNGNNAYTGYVGIYFPGTTDCQKHSLAYYATKEELAYGIIASVWKALINSPDATRHSWNQVLTLQARKKMTEWQGTSERDREELQSYMEAFDGENAALRERNSELNRQVFSLQSQLDALRLSMASGDPDSSFYHVGDEPNLYPSERNDLLYSILSQAQTKYEENSHAYSIISALLQANPKQGEWEHIHEELRRVFRTGKALSKTDKATLQELGFTINEEGPHYKLVFHDPRYTFTVSKTPSDYREGMNMLSDICKALDIEKKIY